MFSPAVICLHNRTIYFTHKYDQQIVPHDPPRFSFDDQQKSLFWPQTKYRRCHVRYRIFMNFDTNMKLVIILTRIWKQFAMATILKFHMTITTVISTWLAFQIFIFLINPTNNNYKEKSSTHYNPIKYALYTQRNYQQTARLDNALQWHHNDRDGVSNHKPHDFVLHFSTVYSGADQRNIKVQRHWPLWGEFTGDRWIPHTKGQ